MRIYLNLNLVFVLFNIDVIHHARAAFSGCCKLAQAGLIFCYLLINIVIFTLDGWRDKIRGPSALTAGLPDKAIGHFGAGPG
ncbi:hypothetical protein BTJ39_00460 [Izhakiella australiensis]|uniref:Uncharacterized protein n=1 Tax=Izhakiella australiensis TaxID=1926881 RepID=A0A1S8YRH0_9GAMM|nr:hypothetical protein BTJ39_00460 [Izhakiella australiensis]